jgi:ferredoxin
VIRHVEERRYAVDMFGWFRSLFTAKPAPAHSCCSNRAATRPAQPPRNPERRIARVLIEEGCTVCNACETTCPEVFKVLEEGVVLVPSAAEHFVVKREAIEEAVEGCPMAVLKIEYEDGSRLEY